MTDSLTAVTGIQVGHWTDEENGTGCTVVLTPNGAVGGVDVRGSAPGTRETDLLHPVNGVDRVHGIVLSGGSAFGLATADGVMRWLSERGHGWYTPVRRVPIVPAAILYDLGVASSAVSPTAESGYAACQAATSTDASRGSVGAGYGCTVGNLLGFEGACRGGLGQAAFTLAGGTVVAALVAVNAIGDIVDPLGARIIAGAREPGSDRLIDALSVARARFDQFRFRRPEQGENTTIGVVATNCGLTKSQVTKMAMMAHDGLARSVRPAHTMHDGDCFFALATGTHDADFDLSLLGAMAAAAVEAAILDGVGAARSLPGLPAASQLQPIPLSAL